MRHNTLDMTPVRYKETLEWMFSRLPMYQRKGKTAFKKNLDNIIAFSAHLDHPERRFPTIHIAGTNGKGSTAHMIASVLQESGYRTGLYTSPHLKDFRERIRLNGKIISKKYVVDFIEKNRRFIDEQGLSFFEMTVALAFDFFAAQKADIAVIETGLGGRLDSTNIITPEISIITNIGKDHTSMLGESIEEIAREKAGIIKPGVPLVTGQLLAGARREIERIAKQKKAPVYKSENEKTYPTDLRGIYQAQNLRTAVKALRVLQEKYPLITEDKIQVGLSKVRENTGLRGRWEVLDTRPLTICDTAHNEDGIKYVVRQLQEQKYRRLHIVFGMVNDKNAGAVLSLLPKDARYYFTRARIPRAKNPEELRLMAERYGLKGKAYKSVWSAWRSARHYATEEDLIFIGGSTFVVAEVL